MSDVKEEAYEEAKRTYSGFITFLKWISIGWIVLILAMCSNNFLEDETSITCDAGDFGSWLIRFYKWNKPYTLTKEAA